MGFYGSFIADTPKPLYNRIKRLKCAENERFRAFVRMRMRAYVPRVIFYGVSVVVLVVFFGRFEVQSKANVR